MSGMSRGLRAEARALLALGLPLVLNNLFTFGFLLTNTAMGGRFGAEHLSAVALGSNVWLPLYLFGMGVLMAISPTVAQHWGARRLEALGEVCRQGQWLALGVGAVVVGLLALVRALDALAPLGLPASTSTLAYGYLGALAWGAPGVFLFQALRFSSEGLGVTTPIMRASALGLAVHVAASAVLVFGLLGAPALGAVGSGVASAIAWWSMAGVMLLTLRRARQYRHLALLERFVGPRPRELGALLWLGLPIGFAILMEAGLFASSGFMMARLGAQVIAAHQVVVNYAAMMFMVPLGLAAATTIRVGQAVGRADLAAAGRTARVAAGLVAAFMLCSALVMVTLGEAVTALYTAEAQVLAVAAVLLPVAAAFQLFDGLQVTAAGALRGLKDTRVPMLLTALAYWGVGVPVAFLLGLVAGLGPRGIWLGLCAGLVVSAALMWLRFLRRLARGVLLGP